MSPTRHKRVSSLTWNEVLNLFLAMIFTKIINKYKTLSASIVGRLIRQKSGTQMVPVVETVL